MDIISVAELVWLQMNPKGSDEVATTKEELITVAQMEAANLLWLNMWNERSREGSYDPPSYLLKQIQVPVKENEVDLSNEGVLTTLPNNIWLQKIGRLTSSCNYVRNTVNQSVLLNDDDSRGHADKTYVVIGDTLQFPNGVHENPLTLIVASMGEGITGEIQVSDEIASAVRDKLLATYLGKVIPEEVTNNSNPTT